MQPVIFVGIDVSKTQLDVATSAPDPVQHFPNKKCGIARLTPWPLTQPSVPGVFQAGPYPCGVGGRAGWLCLAPWGRGQVPGAEGDWPVRPFWSDSCYWSQKGGKNKRATKQWRVFGCLNLDDRTPSAHHRFLRRSVMNC